MNKDVIYIESEDDITDVILKIENAKEKIVAIVPPKKAGVFRSIVNIKLIAKAGVSSGKTVVLVTVDPSIIKLAAATKIPVAKDLQSAPVVPTLDGEQGVDQELSKAVAPHTVELSENEEEAAEESKDADDDEGDEDKEKKEEAEDEDDEPEKKPQKKAKPAKDKTKKSGKGLKNWIKTHKKTAIFGAVMGIGLVVLVVWMLFIAPAVDVKVSIKTEQKNFSEGVTFTDKLESEDAKEGKFYLEQKKFEDTQVIPIEATGQKNRGEKATGKVKVSAVFSGVGSIAINVGTVFTNSGLSFTANEYHGLSWSGDEDECENDKKLKANPDGSMSVKCLISTEVNVTAVEGGSKYNIAASSNGWETLSGASVVSETPMSGGTDDTITVVQQSDVMKAQNELNVSKEEENKKKLFDTIGDNYYIIETSFEQSNSETKVTPGVDEEVKEGTKPTLTTTTVATVYVIDKVKLEEFIREKADLEDNQKIYDIRDIYVENMSRISAGGSTKLKAQYYLGPKITESELVDRIKGRGLGDAQREIRDIYGVSDVKIDTSYPWVMAIPTDSNKVSVEFEVKDQDGNDIDKDSQDESQDDAKEENKDDKKENS